MEYPIQIIGKRGKVNENTRKSVGKNSGHFQEHQF